jgi:hypothetical protein
MKTPVRYARPFPAEYAAYYAAYVQLVPEGDIVEIMARQVDQTMALLQPVAERRAGYRYAPEKWSLKEVVGHLSDTERVFAARALHFARRDPAPLPGFDQDDYVAAGRFDDRSLASLLTEFRAVRDASVTLFRGLDPSSEQYRGLANEVEFTVRSIPYVLAGHELHHVQVIRERYLQEAASG